MKITLFTADQVRHNYLANLFSNIATELNVVQENRTNAPEVITGDYPASDTMKKYLVIHLYWEKIKILIYYLLKMVT